MLRIKHRNGIFEISNRIYKCQLSEARGGSMTSLIYKGIDTMLKREGCEYWTSDKEHYEQEYSQSCRISVLNHYKLDKVIVMVYSSLVSPQLKLVGGHCIVKWIFDASPIIKTSFAILPDKPITKYDRYVCFRPNDFYKEYSFAYDKFEPIEQPSEIPDRFGNFWFEKYYPKEAYSTTVKNDSLFFAFEYDKEITDSIGLFTSKTMLELKSQAITKIVPCKEIFTSFRMKRFYES